ncbi:MAG TPA: BBP7 family outer membrane beta-barrel protein [Gemmatales bacterium]|nr:BBP7 family outer membrane beta-barrel protein [Gemmatales bacterium]
MLRPYLFSASSLLVLVPVVSAQTPEVTKPNATAAAPAPVQVVPDASMPCGDCAVDRHGPWSQVWASFGYARWTMRDAPFAYPLATTGSGNNPGAIGDPNTVVLFGDQPVDFGGFNGLRIDGGVWLNDNHTTGVGFGLTSFGTKSTTSLFSSDANNPLLIARPIFDALAEKSPQIALLVSDPSANLSGSLAIENKAQFYGFDLHVRQNFLHNETWTIDGTLGFRYFNLSEQLLITQRTNYDGDDNNSPLIVGHISYNPIPGVPVFDGLPPFELNNQTVDFTQVKSLLISESFETRNQVYGVQLGTRAEGRWGAFFASFAGKVTLGVNEERIDINGSTIGFDANHNPIANAPGGILAVQGIAPTGFPLPSTDSWTKTQPTVVPINVGNIGVQRYNQFIIMPEFSFEVGMQVTSHVRLFAGYDWLYINDVVRPGNQIDPVINQRYVPSSPSYGTLAGPNKPSYTMNHTDFVAQGFSFGIEFQY